VTQAGYAEEFEIKTSVSDFQADFRKRVGWGRSALKHDILAGRVDMGKWTLPRRFWFVVPAEIADQVKGEVPDHAGLMVAVPPGGRVPPGGGGGVPRGRPVVLLTRVKGAPVVGGARKLPPAMLARLCGSLAWRYWPLWREQREQREQWESKLSINR